MRIGVRGVAVAVTAAMLVGAAFAQGAGKPVKVTAGKYAGTTSENIPITFMVSGRSITQLKTSIGYNGKCGQGGGPGFTISANGIVIASNGTFSKPITLVGPTKAVANQKGMLTGHAAGASVSGSIVDTTTAKLGSCNGYTENFVASHK